MPRTLSSKIFARVNRDLKPSFLDVFKKILPFQLAIGALTTAFCSQLGGICGTIFYGFGALLALLFLTREEVKELRRHQFLQIATVISIAFMGLVMAGAEAPRTEIIAWATGSLLGGWIV